MTELLVVLEIDVIVMGGVAFVPMDDGLLARDEGNDTTVSLSDWSAMPISRL